MGSNTEDEGPTKTDDSDRTDSDRDIQSKVLRQTNGHKLQEAAANAREESGTDTDDDGQIIKAKSKNVSIPKAHQRPMPIKRPTGRVRPGMGINLKDLLDENILTAGEDVLSVEYKGSTTYATLTPEGHILCQLAGKDQRFESPSAFSIALKRLVNPLRKADDGWKTVKYNGRFLDHFKLELARRRLADMGAEDAETSNDAPARKQARIELYSDVASRPSTPITMDAIPKAGSVVVGSNVEDIAQMIPCERFRGEPCSSSGSQPFRVIVSPGVELLMDFHAHLSDNEVIGLLAGSWNPTDRILRVERAFPVQETQSVEDSPTVQMNASDEKAAKLRMANKNNRFICVGWYHSHPHAGTHPSTLDIQEQIKQQRIHRSLVTQDEPYIGAIVSPYAGPSPDNRAQISYFQVDYPKDREIPGGADPVAAGCLPMSLQVEEDEGPHTELYISSMPNHDLRSTAHRCANISRRADLGGVWEGGTKLEKLKTAVTSRLPKSWSSRKVEEYGRKVEAIVTAAWKIFGQPVPAQQEARAQGIRRLKGEEEEVDISDVSAGKSIDSTQWS